MSQEQVSKTTKKSGATKTKVETLTRDDQIRIAALKIAAIVGESRASDSFESREKQILRAARIYYQYLVA